MPANTLRHLLIAGLGAIGVSAILAIVFILLGSWSEIEIKIIVTTLVLGFYLLTMSATVGEGQAYLVLGSIGATIAACGIIMTLPSIWINYHSSYVPVRTMVSIAVIAVAYAHGVINYRLSGNTPISKATMGAANGFVLVVALMVLSLILDDFNNVSEAFVRILIAMAIGDVALTVANPIVAKLSRTQKAAA